MNNELLKIEKELKLKSKNSVEDFLEYLLFEMSPPIEDYYLVIELLEENYSGINDVRLAIIGAYLVSTFLSFKDNIFLQKLYDLKEMCSEQEKAIIYYLHAYDIYMKNDGKFSSNYVSFLQKSIMYSKRFVYNYIRLSEVYQMKEAKKLLEKAIENVENIWDENNLSNISEDRRLKYDDFVNEFILGVDISKNEYDKLWTTVKK